MASNVGKVSLADLRCRVDIQRKELSPDGIGGNTISYSTVYTVWALVENWKGREAYRAERTEGLVYQRVVVRGGITILPSDIVVYQGRTMPVKYINNLQEGKVKYIEMLVIEGDPTGPGAE